MRYLLVFCLSVISSFNCHSQIHEIGGFLGGSNFIGDVGKTNYIAPNQLAFGGIYKWNRSPRHAYRFSIIYSTLKGVDTDSDDPRRQARGYSFNNQIVELSAGMEFTFLDYNLHDGGKKTTPYLFTGVTATSYDTFYLNNQGQKITSGDSKFAYGIPMVIGIKTTMLEKLILAFEIGARYTFTDGLDGSVPEDDALRNQFAFGNVNNNDWYLFTGVTLTFTFGRNPCYCVY